MSKQKIVTFRVSFPIPREATVEECRNYIYESVGTWRGSLHPIEDPMFDLDPDAIQVTRHYKHRRKA